MFAYTWLEWDLYKNKNHVLFITKYFMSGAMPRTLYSTFHWRAELISVPSVFNVDVMMASPKIIRLIIWIHPSA